MYSHINCFSWFFISYSQSISPSQHKFMVHSLLPGFDLSRCTVDHLKIANLGNAFGSKSYTASSLHELATDFQIYSNVYACSPAYNIFYPFFSFSFLVICFCGLLPHLNECIITLFLPSLLFYVRGVPGKFQDRCTKNSFQVETSNYMYPIQSTRPSPSLSQYETVVSTICRHQIFSTNFIYIFSVSRHRAMSNEQRATNELKVFI